MKNTKSNRILELFEKGHRPREIAEAVPCHLSTVYAAIGGRGREQVYRELRAMRTDIERISRELAEVKSKLAYVQSLPDIVDLMLQLRGGSKNLRQKGF